MASGGNAKEAQRDRPVLVTGGAGLIGSHLVEALTRSGRRVTVVDDLSTGRMCNLAGADADHFEFIDARVSDAIAALDPHSFSEIYHLAAAVGVRLVIERPIHTIENNVLETSRLLEFASEARTPTLIASTSEVYGKSERMPFREDDDVVYGPTIYNRWSYACSKAIDEYLALAHHREHGLPVRIVRFFNTVGPRQLGEYGMVLPRFVRAALANEPIRVHGDGRQTRCFCDVRDAVDALPKLLREPSTAGRIVNLGSDESIEIIKLAELVRNTLASSSTIELVSYEQAFGNDFDDLRHRQPDLSRVRSAIGFTPGIPLEQTIRDLAAEIVGMPISSGFEPTGRTAT